jgi:hypothetical protein
MPVAPFEGNSSTGMAGETKVVSLAATLMKPAPETVAWLVPWLGALAGMLTVTVMTGKLEPGFRASARVHTLPEQFQPTPDISAKVNPDGIVSDTVTVPEAAVPVALLTVTV